MLRRGRRLPSATGLSSLRDDITDVACLARVFGALCRSDSNLLCNTLSFQQKACDTNQVAKNINVCVSNPSA